MAWCRRILVVLIAIALPRVALGQGNVKEVKARWLESVSGLFDGMYHYEVELRSEFSDPTVLELGRFAECQHMDFEIGRFKNRLVNKYENRFSASDEYPAFTARCKTYFDGETTIRFEREPTRNGTGSSRYTIYSVDFDKDFLRSLAFPGLDPLVDVLAWPVLVSVPKRTIPGTVESNFNLEAALGDDYSISSQDDTYVELSNGGQDTLKLAKKAGYQIASRVWNSGDERVLVENTGWQRLGSCWIPERSTVTYLAADGSEKFTVRYSFRPLPALTQADFEGFVAKAGETVCLRMPGANGKKLAASTIVTLEPGQSVNLGDAARFDIDLEALYLQNVAAAGRRLPIALILGASVILAICAAGYYFYRSRQEFGTAS